MTFEKPILGYWNIHGQVVINLKKILIMFLFTELEVLFVYF